MRVMTLLCYRFQTLVLLNLVQDCFNLLAFAATGIGVGVFFAVVVIALILAIVLWKKKILVMPECLSKRIEELTLAGSMVLANVRGAGKVVLGPDVERQQQDDHGVAVNIGDGSYADTGANLCTQENGYDVIGAASSLKARNATTSQKQQVTKRHTVQAEFMYANAAEPATASQAGLVEEHYENGCATLKFRAAEQGQYSYAADQGQYSCASEGTIQASLADNVYSNVAEGPLVASLDESQYDNAAPVQQLQTSSADGRDVSTYDVPLGLYPETSGSPSTYDNTLFQTEVPPGGGKMAEEALYDNPLPPQFLCVAREA
ncbi:uncharacterized protein LOC135826079 isoform X2 [Sycon ciliatum]|uniref:uncharacterized protein LOC135826079 isoform X2 n=1 Tax=Sycon ciliatum TaxID=27933 RepID=UPI0031F718B6